MMPSRIVSSFAWDNLVEKKESRRRAVDSFRRTLLLQSIPIKPTGCDRTNTALSRAFKNRQISVQRRIFDQYLTVPKQQYLEASYKRYLNN